MNRSRTHGESSAPEYRVWSGMRDRCSNPNADKYDRYGGRGIQVCDRWNRSFSAFLDDMGRRPSSDHQIDRIDNDGPYSPENCRWATRAEQSRNRSTSRFIELNGERLCLKDWAARIGIGPASLRRRIKRGWDLAEALSAPPLSLPPKVTAARREPRVRPAKVGGKVSEEMVLAIRTACASGERVTDLASRFGLTLTTISQIKTGRTWVHVGGPICPRTRIGPLGQKRSAA
jgi:hypothetical protein